jgi:hypothetical protein
MWRSTSPITRSSVQNGAMLISEQPGMETLRQRRYTQPVPPARASSPTMVGMILIPRSRASLSA